MLFAEWSGVIMIGGIVVRFKEISQWNQSLWNGGLVAIGVGPFF
jgi:hypothetical protein